MNRGCTWGVYAKKGLYTLIIIILLFSLVVAGCSLNSMLAINPATPTSAKEQPPTQVIEPTEPSVVVQVDTEPTKSAITCIVQTGVPSGFLNLRSGPGTEYPVFVVLNEGEELEYVGINNDGSWKLVRQTSSGVQGWVREKYVSCEE